MLGMRTIIVFFIPFLLISIEEAAENSIFVNQIGYLPQQIKYAVVTGEADSFRLFSLDQNKAVLSKKLSASGYWPYSDETIKIADFSEYSVPGRYRIISNTGQSFPFLISQKAYSDISKAALKAFYYQRASIDLPPRFAGKWARKAGHPDTVVYIHPSAVGKTRPAGSVISAPGGWYDAGDYNKYVVNAGITTYTLLLLYELYPQYFDSLSLNIPESGNNIPDILDEVLWEIRWLMRMQDPDDGAIYHKLTCADFQPYIMPDQSTAKRYVVGKSTSAALNFAALLAHASVTFKIYKKGLPGLSDSCLSMSKKAWQWARQHPDQYFSNPDDIKTGVYGDNDLKDEFFWAGIELFLATGDTSYFINMDKIEQMVLDSLYWKHTANLGILTLITHKSKLKNKPTQLQKIEALFKKNVEAIYNNYRTSPYKISLHTFKWGSNANLLNQTALLLTAYRVYNEPNFYKAALANTDYILGRNPLNICYVSGFGSYSPQNIHQRIMEADGVKEPIPGFVVGGPNKYFLTDCGKEKYPSLLPAKCYVDDVCSYSTNEVAINWNAALAFVLNSLNYYSYTSHSNIQIIEVSR